MVYCFFGHNKLSENKSSATAPWRCEGLSHPLERAYAIGIESKALRRREPASFPPLHRAPPRREAPRVSGAAGAVPAAPLA